MASNIEWTDETWNPVVGCSKISPGCANCYAESMAARLKAMALADMAAGKDPGRKKYYIDAIDDKGRWSGKLIPVPEALADPLGWRKPRQVFVNSMSDLFHESVPFSFIDQVFAIMAYARKHTFQVLTKRADRLATYFRQRSLGDVYTNILKLASGEKAWSKSPHDNLRSLIRLTDTWEVRDGFQSEHAPPKAWPLPNVWLGVSCEDQKQWDERVPLLRQTIAAVRFVSAEPLLSEIDGRSELHHPSCPCNPTDGWKGTVGSLSGRPACPSGCHEREDRIHWVIAGGESGHGARKCNTQWVRSLIGQCQEASVKCFVKQLGSNPYEHVIQDMAKWMYPNGVPDGVSVKGTYEHYSSISLKDKKGGDMAEWSADLCVREFPISLF